MEDGIKKYHLTLKRNHIYRDTGFFNTVWYCINNETYTQDIFEYFVGLRYAGNGGKCGSITAVDLGEVE